MLVTTREKALARSTRGAPDGGTAVHRGLQPAQRTIASDRAKGEPRDPQQRETQQTPQNHLISCREPFRYPRRPRLRRTTRVAVLGTVDGRHDGVPTGWRRAWSAEEGRRGLDQTLIAWLPTPGSLLRTAVVRSLQPL